MSSRLPVLFLSHGPGPAWLLDESSAPMFKGCGKNSKSALFLRQLRKTVLDKYPPIKAVLIVSAHWVEPVFTVQKLDKPDLLYDYNGFPEETYHLKWPVNGAPDLAKRTEDLLKTSGLDVKVETKRGLDHGAFIPLMLVFQEADIPIFEVSLRADWDMASHFKLGESLSKLREEGVLIVTSGHTTHRSEPGAGLTPPEWAVEFRDWIHDVLTNTQYTPDDRKEKLLSSAQQRTFKKAHPTWDHYLPLPIASAAASYSPGQLLFEDYIMGSLLVSHYLFE